MTPLDFLTLRRALKLSQAHLGAKLDLSRNTISRYESGQYAIPRAIQLAMLQLTTTKEIQP